MTYLFLILFVVGVGDAQYLLLTKGDTSKVDGKYFMYDPSEDSVPLTKKDGTAYYYHDTTLRARLFKSIYEVTEFMNATGVLKQAVLGLWRVSDSSKIELEYTTKEIEQVVKVNKNTWVVK